MIILLKFMRLFISFVFLFSTSFFLQAQNAPSSNRKVSITIDDLPTISLLNTPSQKKEITTKILEALKNRQAPAIGFVNEVKLFKGGNVDTAQIALLNLWLEAGMELGNHTYSHPSFHKTDTSKYFEDILRGQMITTTLGDKGTDVIYFRHPYLHTGNTKEKKTSLDNFLRQHELIIAPVTIDNSDWIFARAYDNAIIANDSVLMEKIGQLYIQYMESYFSYYEKQSTELFGYEMNQILLLHANSINADYLGELLGMLRARNYEFVPISDALQDKAYQTPEGYIGEGGISWIHRWAISQGKEKDFFAGEPEVPELVSKAAALN